MISQSIIIMIIWNLTNDNKYICMICYDLCINPYKSKCCKKYFCKSHIEGFFDKCPNCRKTPFKSDFD